MFVLLALIVLVRSCVSMLFVLILFSCGLCMAVCWIDLIMICIGVWVVIAVSYVWLWEWLFVWLLTCLAGFLVMFVVGLFDVVCDALGLLLWCLLCFRLLGWYLLIVLMGVLWYAFVWFNVYVYFVFVGLVCWFALGCVAACCGAFLRCMQFGDALWFVCV